MPNTNDRIEEITILRQKRSELLGARQNIQENRSPIKLARDNQMVDFFWIGIKLLFTNAMLNRKCKAQGGHFHTDSSDKCDLCGRELHKKTR